MNVVDLNNRAIALMIQGNPKQAAALLRTAITNLKDHFVVREHGPRFSSSAETVDSESSSDEMDSDAPSFIKVNRRQDEQAILSVPIWTEESFAQKDDKTLIFLYGQALVLARTEHCKEKLIAVVLYNAALANHAWAIESDTSSLLAVALKFYGMAVAILNGQTDVDVNTSTYWVLLALYNNMAQIYLSQACSGKLRSCLGNIRALLAADRTGQAIDGDDYSFFLTNAMLELSVVASPAA
jgi:hypothetical protein